MSWLVQVVFLHGKQYCHVHRVDIKFLQQEPIFWKCFTFLTQLNDDFPFFVEK